MAAGTKCTASMLKQLLKVSSSAGGLDSALAACRVVAGTPGTCTLAMTVAKEHSNLGGTLHGGFSAHLVDSVTTLALMTAEGGLPGVSVDMHLTYLKAAQVGEEVEIVARTVRKGRTLAFLECEIRSMSTGAALVRGSHTKFIGG